MPLDRRAVHSIGRSSRAGIGNGGDRTRVSPARRHYPDAVRAAQLKVLGSVLRTTRIPAGPEISVAGSEFAFRRCMDGSYCVASSGTATAQITPDSFRLLRSFRPLLRKERKNIRLRVGRQFLAELLQPRHWKPDVETPFEHVLDPQPDDCQLDQTFAALRAAEPSFAGALEAKR